MGDQGSMPRLGRSPRGGYGNLLQCSCLENPHRQRSLVGYSPWGRKESDMTWQLNNIANNIQYLFRIFKSLVGASSPEIHPQETPFQKLTSSFPFQHLITGNALHPTLFPFQIHYPSSKAPCVVLLSENFCTPQPR